MLECIPKLDQMNPFLISFLVQPEAPTWLAPKKGEINSGYETFDSTYIWLSLCNTSAPSRYCAYGNAWHLGNPSVDR